MSQGNYRDWESYLTVMNSAFETRKPMEVFSPATVICVAPASGIWEHRLIYLLDFSINSYVASYW
jgi:hypothetical protein